MHATPSATTASAGEPVARQRRTMLAFDAALGETMDLEAAIELVALLDAEVHALFVEDPDLAACSALPFARELARIGMRSRGLEREAVDRALRRGVERARRRLDAAAQRLMLRVSIDSVRGKLVRIALEQAASAQFVVLPQARGAARARPGAHVSAVRRPVLLWWEGEQAGAAALDLAARLAVHAGTGLVAAHAAGGAGDGERLRAAARAALGAAGAPLWLAALDDAAPGLLQALAARLGTGVLVMAADSRLATEPILAALAASGRGPLVLAR